MATQTQTQVVKLDTKQPNTGNGQSLTKLAIRRLLHDRLTLLAMGVLLILTVMSALAPVISAQLEVSSLRTDSSSTFLPPLSPGHLLGTDDIGRDQLSRLLYAGQVSLLIAFIAAFLSVTLGVSIGILSGYYGGVIDDVVNWVITTLTSIPQLFLILIVAAVLSPGPTTLILVLGLIGWTGTARLVRGETLSLREREFVVGARAIGASPLRIMFIHILPNLFSIIVITLAIDIGSLILTEAALSFLGVGVTPPTPSWGNMLTVSQTYFNLGPWLVVFPGLLIFITVLCLYVIGDGLRDAFDPTAKD